MRTLSFIIHAQLKIDLMLRKTCPCGLGWTVGNPPAGYWRIWHKVLWFLYKHCPPPAAVGRNSLPLLWKAPRSRFALSGGCGMLGKQSCFPVTGVKEPGCWGREALGKGRAGFRHLPGRRCLALVCIGQVNPGNVRLSARRGCWWEFSGYKAFPEQSWSPGLLINSGQPGQSHGCDRHIHSFTPMPWGELCLQGLS